MIFQLAALFIRAWLEVHLIDNGTSPSVAGDLSYLVVPPLLLVLMYPILRRHGTWLFSLLRRDDLTIRLITVSVLLGIALRATYWGGLVSLVSSGVLRNDDPNAVVGPIFSFACPGTGVLALSFLVGALLIPIVEETLNRGLLLKMLETRGRVFAVVVSSAIFALAHDPQAIVTAFLGGLFLGMQLLISRTLWAPLISHSAYNSVAILDWECLDVQWNPVW